MHPPSGNAGPDEHRDPFCRVNNVARRRLVRTARRSVVRAASAAVAISLGCAPDARTSDLGTLELELAETVPIPSNWSVRRVIALRDGGHVFVLHYPARLVLLSDSTVQLRMPSRVVIGIRETHAGGLELVDRTHRTVLEVGLLPEPTVSRAVSLGGGRELWDATWADGHWLVLAGDSVGPPTVYRVSGEGDLRPLSSPNEDVVSRLARISTVGGEILLSEVAYPFRVFLLDRGNWRMLSGLERPNLDLTSSVAMQLVDLEGVALQTVVDQRSSRRVVRVFSPRSGIGRSIVIDAPLVLQGVDAQRHVLGLRTSQREELALYSWRWR